MDDFWRNKIKAFLHDPPDKVLKISNHEERRDSLLQVLGLNFDIPKEFDWIASSMERIVPKTDLWIDFSRTDRVFHPILRHPISGERKDFGRLSESVLGLKKSKVDEVLAAVLAKENEILERLRDRDYKITYFRIWRIMKNLIERELSEELANLPADTRCPDHTIWDHLDTSSAIYGAINKGTLSLLMFKLAPVQNFIRNARKERDLWAGSHLLSYLTFQAMKVVIDEFGPDAIIFPHLRGQPFFDFEYLNYFGDLINRENLKIKLDIANIPNKFLAIINFESIDEVKDKIRKALDKTLNDLFNFSVKRTFGSLSDRVINYSLEVLQNYFNVTVCEMPADLEKLRAIIDDLPEDIKEKYKKWLRLIKAFGYKLRIFDLYSLMFELLEEIVAIESRKFEKLIGVGKPKCSLCGELEIFGNKEIWKNVSRRLFKENENLCPVCLVKRIYPDWFKERVKKKGITEIDIGFESVSEIALKKSGWLKLIRETDSYGKLVNTLKRHSKLRYLVKNDELVNPELLYIENWNIKYIEENFGINVSETDLEEPKRMIKELYDEYCEPEKYYAILMMDGDNMGRMLIGDEMETIDCYLHPKVVDYLPNELREEISKVKRLITPATHSAISRALAHFSINIVPKIIERHEGEPIYAGGDDVLALLPTDSALACAYEIQEEFKKDWDGWNVLPAKTMSAGILIVHYKHPLYDAIDRVRELERKAKSLGRNAVTIGYLTRGGSYYEVTFNWNIVSSKELREFVKLLLSESKPRLSRRIIYDVFENIESLPRDESAIKAYLKFEFLRHYDGDDKRERTEDLAEKALELAKSIRIALSSNDLKELITLPKVELSRLNEKINKLISNSFSIEGLKNVLRNLSIKCNVKELYGLIVRKQVKDFFILLKILRECEFIGDIHENTAKA